MSDTDSQTASKLVADDGDRADILRLVNGQDEALNELMGRYAPKLMSYFVRCLQDEDLAGDLTQETFVRVYQHRMRFDSRQKFSTWLYAIASNLVRDHLRWKSRRPEARQAEDGPDPPAIEPSPSEQLQAEEQAGAVRDAVASLPEDLRIPLILAEYEEKSQVEIAGILGCTTKAVETRIYRARQQLRIKLAKFLQPEEDL